MSPNHKNQPLSSPDGSPRLSGAPGCFWMLLGGGISLVLIAVGLLLVFVPSFRQGAPQVSPPAEQTSITITDQVPATYTPYFTMTSAANQQETATPTPYQDLQNQTEIPDDPLVSTPSSQEGYLSISPYITADAMHYSLEVGQDLNLDWVDFPPGAAQYQILLIPDGGGTELILIEDDNPEDGIGGVWQVPKNIGGELQGAAIFPDGRLVTTVSGGWIYSKDPE